MYTDEISLYLTSGVGCVYDWTAVWYTLPMEPATRRSDFYIELTDGQRVHYTIIDTLVVRFGASITLRGIIKT